MDQSRGDGNATLARPKHEMAGWVVLCHRAVDIDEERSLAAFERAFPGHFLPPNEGSFVVGGPSPEPFLVKSTVPGASGLFCLHAIDGYYLDPHRGEFDPAVADLIRDHRAWLAIDIIAAFDAADPYAFASPAIAHLAPPTATVLWHPARRIARPLDDGIRKRLIAGLQPSAFGLDS